MKFGFLATVKDTLHIWMLARQNYINYLTGQFHTV